MLAAFTGSQYFPGGVSGYTIPAGSLKFEKGPTVDIPLEWATYFDASDQAGQSRLWGWIHVETDDFIGRRLCAACGTAAWALAQRYYDGKVTGSLPRPPAQARSPTGQRPARCHRARHRPVADSGVAGSPPPWG